MRLSVSILSAYNRIECIKKLNNTNIDYFHIDIMDGKFVDNKELPINEVNKLSKYMEKPLDIHLMVERPLDYINNLNNENIRNITIHEEINGDKIKIINRIKEKGYKAGLSIKPNTDISKLIPYLDYIDIILIMSVEPGLGGQKFIPETVEKIDNLNKLLNKYNKKIDIEVDGGINNQTIKLLKNKINISVVGSYITKSDNYQDKINISVVGSYITKSDNYQDKINNLFE